MSLLTTFLTPYIQASSLSEFRLIPLHLHTIFVANTFKVFHSFSGTSHPTTYFVGNNPAALAPRQLATYTPQHLKSIYLHLVYIANMALKYAPFGSEIDLPFYTALSQSKIDHDKLDDSARTVIGLYEPRIVGPEDSCRMRVLGNALTSDE